MLARRSTRPSFPPDHLVSSQEEYPFRREVYDYTGRLLRGLGLPPLVVATHWDRSILPLDANFDAQRKDAEAFKAEVLAIAPKTRVVVPPHFEWIPFSGNPH